MSQPLKLYDTYQKTKVTITPTTTVEPNTIKMYSCGPTVYNYQSIGNMRAAWLPDTIAKVARLAGWQVEWTLNITDVGHLVSDGDEGEDKIEKGARREGKTVAEIVAYYTQDYLQQCRALHFDLPRDFYNPRATDYIKEQMLLALQLLANHQAYLTDDGIYFDTLANRHLKVPQHPVFADYAKPVDRSDTQKLRSPDVGYTGRDIVQTDKKHPDDFALWKFVSEKSLQKWKFNQVPETENLMIEILPQLDPQNYDLPNRYGCPGWHSECVCMICGTLHRHFPPKITGQKALIDIHTGGEDHIEVHHKNEILQSEALGFHLSKYWVHNKFVMVDGGKMSKSLGNVYLVVGTFEQTGFYSLTNPPEDIASSLQARHQISGFEPLAYRLMLLEHHYTEQLNFTWEKLEQSQLRLWNLRKEAAKLGQVQPLEPVEVQHLGDFQRLLELLTDNLNLPKFLEEYQKLLLQATKTREPDLAKLLQFFDQRILQLDLFVPIPPSVLELVRQRVRAREAKDFAKSDQLREQIAKLGWQIDDYVDGWGAWPRGTRVN